ncbi:MAG: AlpA family phage regulatory protein [Methylococcaceae bacterium]
MTKTSADVRKTRKKTQKKVTYLPVPLPAEGFVRLPSVLAVLGISKTTYYDGIKAGKYPPGKLLSRFCRVWSVTEIRDLLSKINDRAD